MADPYLWYYPGRVLREKFEFSMLVCSNNFDSSFSDVRSTLGLLEKKLLTYGFGLKSDNGDYFATNFPKPEHSMILQYGEPKIIPLNSEKVRFMLGVQVDCFSPIDNFDCQKVLDNLKSAGFGDETPVLFVKNGPDYARAFETLTDKYDESQLRIEQLEIEVEHTKERNEELFKDNLRLVGQNITLNERLNNVGDKNFIYESTVPENIVIGGNVFKINIPKILKSPTP